MRNVLRFILRYRILLTLLLLQVSGLYLTYWSSPIHESFYWSRVLGAQAEWNQTRDGWKAYFELENTNLALQAENARLRAQVSQPAARPINAVDSNQFVWVSGQVIYGTSHLLNNILLLNRGRADGVEPGQGVLSPTGVLGVVSDANEHFAKVTSLLHAESRISGTVARSGFFGTVVWTGGAANLVDYIDLPIEAQVSVGDTIVTDARSALFPSGWPIGVVVEVETDSSLFTQSAVLEVWGSISRQQPAYIVKNVLEEAQNSLLPK